MKWSDGVLGCWSGGVLGCWKDGEVQSQKSEQSRGKSITQSFTEKTQRTTEERQKAIGKIKLKSENCKVQNVGVRIQK